MAYTGKKILIVTIILSVISGIIACGSPAETTDNTIKSTVPTDTVVLPTATVIPATPTTIPATPTLEPTPTPTQIVVTVPIATVQPEVIQATATPVPTEPVASDGDSLEETSITSPLTGPTGAAIEPLKNILIYLIYFDSRSKSWSVYDHAGTFTLEDLTPILMGTMPDSVSPITTIESNQPAYVKVDKNTSFMGRNLTEGYNLIVWKP